MRGKVFAGGIAVLVMGSAFAPFGHAADLVQFTTTSTGSRTLTAATPPVFPASTDLKLSQTISTTSAGGAAAGTTVSEVFANGNSWSVTAQMCGPDAPSLPTAPDCAAKANRMDRSDGSDTIAGSGIAVAHGSPAVVTGGGSTSAGSETSLGNQITVLSNTGQNPNTTYNGTYTGTTNLTISNFGRTGTWVGYWVVTATL